VDTAGRIYIADLSHNRVRRVATNGVISTVAGTGSAAFSGDGGPATNAGLQAVADIALDAQGNLFVADMLNSRIRKVGTNGIITTVAGDGTLGFSGDGGSASNAALNRPSGVTVDREGNLFIADQYGHRVRRVGVDGVIRTVAGTGAGTYSGDGGPATNAALRYPYDVALDDAGNLYIADDENHRVRKVGTNGIITTVAGRGLASYGGDGGAATNARISYVTDIAFDGAGNLYICDAGNQRIRMVAGGAGGWMLSGTPGSSDVGSTGIVLYVSDGTHQVPQFFALTVGQLAAPTNLAAVAVGAGRIDLTWSDNNAEETGYVLERRVSTAAVWTVTATLAANSTSYSDMGLAAGQEYQYRIMAQNAEGTTTPSAVAYATTPGLPAAPGGLTASAVSTSTIALAWVDLSNNEQGFELQRRIGAAGSWSSIASLPADSVAWTDTGLLPNTLHAYRMRATNAAGVSAFSAEASANTPPATNDTDCGHLLVVTATNLLFDGVLVSPPATVPPATMVGGSLDCGQSSPRGAGTVHRVAMGFRDAAGVAIGAAREVTLLYGTPGCPGRAVDDVAVPDALRAPTNAGSYRLWIEAYLSGADPRSVFASQVRTGETALARNLGSVVVQARPPDEVEVRMLSGNGLVSQMVSVPVLVSSTGGENAISFSVAYNTSVLAGPVVMSGSDAPALWTIVNTGTAGRVGCVLLMPGEEVLSPGTKRVADVVFRAIATGVSSVVFADTPVARDVSLLDPGATPSVTWVGAEVVIRTAGYEGDLAPRPGGNQLVDEADRLLLQLIAAGLDAPADSNEFQKADCAPRATSGDGRINVSDLRQLYRYASGFDPLQAAAGPWSATNVPAPPSAPGYAPRAPLSASGSRTVALGDVATNRGDVVRLPVALDAQGDESALGFSLSYDPELLTFVDLQLTGPATNANVAPAVQRAEEGVVGLALVWPANQVVPAGLHTVAEVLFSSAAGGQSVTTTVVLGDEPMPRGVAGTDAGVLAADFSTAALVSLLVAEEAPGAPEAPSGLSAVAVATNQINLAWTDTASNENGYRLMRRAEAGAWTEIVTLSAGATSYEDVGLEPGATYRYLVEAFNGVGARLGDEVSATTWSPMDAWRNARFGSPVASGVTADAGDWDQDGLPNMIEYALGLDPRVDDYPMMPFAWQAQGGVVIGGNRFLTAEYELRPGAAGDMRVRMQVGGSLREDPVDMIPVDEVLSDGVLRRRVRSDEPLGARGFEYLRMMVEPEKE
jgi:sugar lactone lactonase YvrE